jgi:ABC-type multidrug transport system fused ATPase/permease subunit
MTVLKLSRWQFGITGAAELHAFGAATAGLATLLITHELDGLDQVDEIVVLDHGRVAERGTHAELVRSGGAYHRLWQAGHPGRPA